MSNMLVSLIWPLESGPLPFSEAQEMYDSTTSYCDPKGLSSFFTDYLHCEPDFVQRHGFDAFKTLHYYPNIEEDGAFPDGPDDWFTPAQMKATAEKMRRLIDSAEPDGAALREAYLDCQYGRFGPDDYREMMKKSGPSVEEHLERFREDLDWLIEACTVCEQRGIDRVAVCCFG
jgi:hypothetical protein